MAAASPGRRAATPARPSPGRVSAAARGWSRVSPQSIDSTVSALRGGFGFATCGLIAPDELAALLAHLAAGELREAMRLVVHAVGRHLFRPGTGCPIRMDQT